MVVETHVHIVAPDQGKYPRRLSHSTLSGWVQDLPTEELLSLMDGAGIDRAVLVQAYGAYGADNSYVADTVARYPERFAGVFAVDPLQADAAQRATHWAAERGLRGLRIITLTQPELMLSDPRTQPMWERAAALNIPLCITTEFHQVPLLPALLERFPNVKVVLEHMGMPNLKWGPPYQAAQPLFDLARFPNCYVKFSTVSIYAAMAGKSSPAEFFRRLLDRFGPRLMWGSNFPSTRDRGLKEQLQLAREQLAFLLPDEQRQVFGETALDLWPALR
jgi:L-fuconolactonase